jgi:hypothetical protein
MTQILIAILFLFFVYIVYGAGYTKGYREGYDQGVMSGGEGARKIVNHHNKQMERK